MSTDPSQPALRIRGLSKTYGNGVEALAGIDLEVAQGEFFGLLGPNGAGKSTTIGIVTSLINRSGGSVEVFGVDTERDLENAKRLIGVVPQEINLNQFEQPLHIVAQQAGYYGIPWREARDRAEQCLRWMGLWDKRSVMARSLSGGMKRRLMIARALVHGPRLLILDEPTAGVDIEIRRATWELLEQINAAGTTIILTTHYLEEAEALCRRIAIIDGGRIVQNTDTRSLLRQLSTETFVLDPIDPLDRPPALDGFATRLRDDGSFEVEVARGSNLNDVFGALERGGVRVSSMRNKANRLEELFLRLVEQSKERVGSPADSGAGR
ncbi:MAG: ABC transporter ATP-binding protein [Planctomycetes bacterium]|nr:ABC transporter ATP-binding protein [Planctomycetota bacterium]